MMPPNQTAPAAAWMMSAVVLSQIGALLAKGTCLSDVAMRLHVSINTVKTHLRGIYEKLGTSKQAQVVARLNHSSARLL